MTGPGLVVASHVDREHRVLKEATERGWVVIDMKSDWKKIFPEAK